MRIHDIGPFGALGAFGSLPLVANSRIPSTMKGNFLPSPMRRLLAALSVAAVLVPASAFAITHSSTDNLARFSLRNDLYMAGEDVRITEAVDGDLNAAGQNVTTMGAVGGTLQAAGRNVSVRGPVGGNVRAAGSSVVIEGAVNGSVLAFGETVVIASGAVVDGDAVIMGTNVTIAGTVKGAVKLGGQKITVSGTVDGDAELDAESVSLTGKVGGNTVLKAHTVSLGNGATVAGDTRFWTTPGTEDQRRIQGVTKGTATYDAALERMPGEHDRPAAAAALLGVFSLFSLMTGALLILVFQLATKKLFVAAAATLRKSPWMALLVGALYFTLLPVLAILLLVTVVAWPLALIAGMLWLISLLVAKALSAVVIARAIEAHRKAKWSGPAAFFASFGVYMLLRLLMVIPVIGWLACMVAVFMAVGAYMMTKGKIIAQVR
jgi:cytoskeletal protein CcmA (bactofilin family)